MGAACEPPANLIHMAAAACANLQSPERADLGLPTTQASYAVAALRSSWADEYESLRLENWHIKHIPFHWPFFVTLPLRHLFHV